MIRIGTTRTTRGTLPQAESEYSEFYRHLHTPWMDECIARHYGIESDSATAEGEGGGFTDLAVSRHTLISGTTGAGKSRLYLLMAGQLLQQGCSMVAIDLKEDTLLHLTELARQAGVLPENVTAFLPRQEGGIPGWNPLAGADPAEAAEEFADTIWAANERGPQMAEAMGYALIPITAHGLALPELMQLLRSADYRNRILSLPDPPGMGDEMDLAREYFKFDYASTYSTAVTNKFSAVIRNPYLRRVVSADGNTVDFDRLWETGKDAQRLIVVHLDKKSLGADAMRFLGGSIAWRTYRAAARSGGDKKRPVVLGLDEIGLAEGYLSGALSEILAIARGKNLRLIASAQYISQLPARVQSDLMKLTHARAYLRIEADDAAVVAQTLSPGKQVAVPRRVFLEPATPPREQKNPLVPVAPILDYAFYPLHDSAGNLLAIRDTRYAIRDTRYAIRDTRYGYVGRDMGTWDAFRDMLSGTSSRDNRKAAGSLQKHIQPGHFVVCDQFVDRNSGRKDTFYDGPVTTHVSAAEPYCPILRDHAVAILKQRGLPLHERGTTVVIQGPRFSTKAESQWFSRQGWEVINMTQYPECFLARELEMSYVNVSLITDYDAGLIGEDGINAVSASDMVRVFHESNTKLREALFAMIETLPNTENSLAKHALVCIRP